MSRFIGLVAIALLPLTGATSSLAETPPGGTSPTIRVSPSTVTRAHHARITISGIRTRSLQVRVNGATDRAGRPLPWQRLRRSGGVWRGILPAPALRGVYRIRLRTGSGALRVGPAVFLRVLALRTGRRPSFRDPAAVARWWVRHIAHGTPTALKRWPRPTFDRRDVRLHRLFVVAYTLPRHGGDAERLGMFVTAFRSGYHGRWRMLEATVVP
jgi:hypothetical protein